MRVVVVGAGLMGAQIGVEYLAGGHEVTFVARDLDALKARLDDALSLASRLGLGADASAARLATAAAEAGAVDLVVESLPEDLALKATSLRPIVDALSDVIVATNTSSLSITDLGSAIEAPERTIGVHYWNPPLLMPLVEVVPGERTSPAVVTRLTEELRRLGKLPVQVDRDVPGFVWNRLQLAVMREALWLVDNGVASPETVDTVVREGLARRWRQVGPFAAAALGGASTWLTVGENLLPELSSAPDLATLPAWLERDPEALGAIRERRDAGLAEQLRLDGGTGAPAND